MGGDRAPEEIVAGAREALSNEIEPVLFGPREVIQPLAPDLEIVDAPQVVGMHEKPADAARDKRDSSLFTACRAVAAGDAHVVVSAGNTGAMLAAGLLEIGRLPDVSRPAIAAPLPAMRRVSVLIDAGANADARPEHLVQSAHMGTIFSQEVIGVADPEVALLSIGEEPEKGNRLTREAHRLLAEEPGIRFVGNMEGRLLLEGGADVVVCDGFTGNMALKVLEGTVRTVLDGFREEVVKSQRGKVGGAHDQARSTLAEKPARSRYLRRCLPSRPQGPRHDRARQLVSAGSPQCDPAQRPRRQPRRDPADGRGAVDSGRSVADVIASAW